MKITRLNIKEKVIQKFESLLTPKYRLLSTDAIYFENFSGNISYVTCKDGYNIFVRKDGSRVFPRAIEGKDLMDLIQCLKKNNYFGYFYVENQRCKVKSKK